MTEIENLPQVIQRNKIKFIRSLTIALGANPVDANNISNTLVLQSQMLIDPTATQLEIIGSQVLNPLGLNERRELTIKHASELGANIVYVLAQKSLSSIDAHAEHIANWLEESFGPEQKNAFTKAWEVKS